MVIFDLDGTLAWIGTHPLDVRPADYVVRFPGDGDVYLYVYLRPLAVEVLSALHRLNMVDVVIWSAGEASYVTTVVEQAIVPAVRAVCPGFAFKAIYTRDDARVVGKNIVKWIDDKYALDVPVVIIDDSPIQCTLNCIGETRRAYHIQSYHPESSCDLELLSLVRCGHIFGFEKPLRLFA